MSPGPYKMGTLSRITGLSPVLLRAWERRYALLRPQRGPGGHRLYSEEDLTILLRTQELMKDGRSIGEVAALGRQAILGSSTEALPVTGPEGREEPRTSLLDRLRSEVVAAAIDLNPEVLTRTLDEAAAAFSLTVFIEKVMEPAAREIGDLWQDGRCSIASEHLASAAFVHRLRKLLESTESVSDQDSPLVVAACLPGEEHQLGLLILCYFLSCRGVRVMFLGADLPLEELLQTRSRRPSAVLLSVTRRQTFQRNRPGLLKLATEMGRQTRFYIGGGGVQAGDPELERAGFYISRDSESARDAATRIVRALRQR